MCALRGRAHFGVADDLRLPFASDAFDRVLTERCVQNLPAHALRTDVMAELLRSARPSGLVVMAEQRTGVNTRATSTKPAEAGWIR